MIRAMQCRHRVPAVLAALAVLAPVALAACGGASAAPPHPSAPTSTTHPQTLAQRYTTIVSDGDRQLQALSSKLNGANGNVVAIQSGFRSVSATFQGVATQVHALPFPAAMHGDVAAMESALSALAADAAQGGQSVTTAEFNLVFTKLAADQKAEVVANTTVNHDLGISAIN